MRTPDGPQKLFKFDERIGPDHIEACLAAAAIFKAIHHFLKVNDRYIELDARLLYVFSLWQWFNLLKIITEQLRISNENEDMRNLSDPNQSLIDEFSIAYRTVDEVFRDPDFVDGFQYINWWTNDWVLSPGLLDNLAYSLVLMPLGSIPESGFLLTKPLPIPGFEQNKRFNWQSVKLHQVFKEYQPAKIAVKRLVTHFSLPKYDFNASLNLAHLLRKNQPLPIKWITWLYISVLAAILILPVFINNFGWPLDSNIPSVESSLAGITFVVFVIGFFAALSSLFILFHRGLIIHLLLPRVWAGILVGYSVLLIEEGSVKITCTIWGYGNGLWTVVWLVLFFVSFVYLYHDIKPWAVDTSETLKRLLQTLLITMIFAVLIGFVIVPLTTATFPGNCCQKLFRGIFPLGKVDFKQLSVFVPIAYLTGLVSQFIFEEKPLTTSVWAPQRD